jgi:hypothetical protein
LLLPFPDPYDFVLSTERFRVFGADLANLWVDGALHRAVGGREVRIAAASGGVDVEPLDDLSRPVVGRLLGLPFDLDAFTTWASSQPVLAEIVPRLDGFRPPLSPDPFESLVASITAQQVSLNAASRFAAASSSGSARRRGRLCVSDEESVRTIEAHRRHILDKLRLSTRAELVRYALERRILEIGPP